MEVRRSLQTMPDSLFCDAASKAALLVSAYLLRQLWRHGSLSNRFGSDLARYQPGKEVVRHPRRNRRHPAKTGQPTYSNALRRVVNKIMRCRE